jgi:hypothetical protein
MTAVREEQASAAADGDSGDHDRVSNRVRR